MKTDEITNVNQLLTEVNRIYEHQLEIKRLKGENFNIFSILQMESKENATHSAFLGELLNPSGSHLLKNTFLKLFIERVSYTGALDANSAKLELEKHIGKIDLKAKTGGRIDIFISDTNGNTISIENKLYATDQAAQIERYVNFNKDKNTVYYLTLDRKLPSDNSSGDLQKDHDFECISYQETIIKWLTRCMKEAAEQPMLRESIKQYILLIKKLTNQLSDNLMEDQVLESIKSNFQAARLIADNLERVELKYTRKFLEELKERLQEALGEDSIVEVYDDLTKAWSGLTITFQEWNGIRVKLEGHSKIPWNDSIYGIHANKSKWNREDIINQLSGEELFSSGFNSNLHWAYCNWILYFGKIEERAKLLDDDLRILLVQDTAEKLIEMVEICKEPLSKVRKLSE